MLGERNKHDGLRIHHRRWPPGQHEYLWAHHGGHHLYRRGSRHTSGSQQHPKQLGTDLGQPICTPLLGSPLGHWGNHVGDVLHHMHCSDWVGNLSSAYWRLAVNHDCSVPISWIKDR